MAKREKNFIISKKKGVDKRSALGILSKAKWHLSRLKNHTIGEGKLREFELKYRGSEGLVAQLLTDMISLPKSKKDENIKLEISKVWFQMKEEVDKKIGDYRVKELKAMFPHHYANPFN